MGRSEEIYDLTDLLRTPLKFPCVKAAVEGIPDLTNLLQISGTSAAIDPNENSQPNLFRLAVFAGD